VALTLTMTFGLMGFAVDLGFAEFRKHAEQVAADSAAMAAAAYAVANSSTCSSGITCNTLTNCTIPGSVSTPLGAACVYAQANGYTNGGGTGGTQTVTFKANNTSSPVSGNSPSLWFQVTVGDSYSTLFGRFGGYSALAIRASSVAAITTTGGGNCIIALGQSGTGFSDSGSGNITTTNCGIYDNANFSYSGSGNITTLTTQYYGTKSVSGSGNLSPAPTNTTSLASDPFATMATVPPTVGSCTNPNPAVGSTAALSYPLVLSDSSSHTVNPGTYCGGITISGSGNITFNTGIYIINGTGSGSKSFSYSGSGNLSGTNVLFFMTGQNGYTAGPMSISGSGNLTFSAQSSGAYKGVLFWQDHNASTGANTYTGSGNVTGTFYFPNDALTYSGSGNAAFQAIVAKSITMSGSGNFSKDTTGQYTGMVQTNSALIQ
jgi:hypothetical protein